MDITRFDAACELVRQGGRLIKGIGTKSEGSVHAVLKNYFESEQTSQEVSVGRFIADIVGETGIIEIQTSHFKALSEKLRAFLPVTRVTVVFPVYLNKRIVYISEDGVVERSRVSPLKGSPLGIFREMIYIAEYLRDENLSFKIMVLDCDEYRVLPPNGKKGRGKIGSVTDRFPTRLIDEITIASPGDWVKLIPCLHQEDITVSDVYAITHAPRKAISTALAVLYRGGVLRRTGKKGRAFSYSFSG